MAFILDWESKHGVTYPKAYLKVAQVTLDLVHRRVLAVVGIWVSAQARLDGVDPIELLPLRLYAFPRMDYPKRFPPKFTKEDGSPAVPFLPGATELLDWNLLAENGNNVLRTVYKALQTSVILDGAESDEEDHQ